MRTILLLLAEPIRRLGLALLLSLVLGGCSGNDEAAGNVDTGPKLPIPDPSDPGSSYSSYEAVATAADGSQLQMTVFAPAAAGNKTAPLLIHLHDFGQRRLKTLRGVDARSIASSYLARLARDAGFYVISLDQRGFGGSAGNELLPQFANLGDVGADRSDLATVVDWALANLPLAAGEPALALDEEGDPRLAVVGLGYGATVALVSAHGDHRFDAVLALLPYYDLARSLFPNGLPKSQWLNLFLQSDFAGRLPAAAVALFSDPNLQLGGGNPEQLDLAMQGRGMVALCDGTGGAPRADLPTYLVGGWRDSLMPANEVFDIADCLRTQGTELHLLLQEGGHELPVGQGGIRVAGPLIDLIADHDPTGTVEFFVSPEGNGITSLTLADTANCDDHSFRIGESLFAFLGGLLPLEVESDAYVPSACYAFGKPALGRELDLAAVTPLALDIPQQRFNEPAVTSTLRTAVAAASQVIELPPEVGLLETLASCSIPELEQELPLPRQVPETLQLLQALIEDPLHYLLQGHRFLEFTGDQFAAFFQEPYWIPLYTAEAEELLLGVPTVNVGVSQVTPGNPTVLRRVRPVSHLAVGLQRAEDAEGQQPEVLGDQVLPLTGNFNSSFAVSLPGVAASIRPGDQLGLLVYPYQLQYATLFPELNAVAVNVRDLAGTPVPYICEEPFSFNVGGRVGGTKQPMSSLVLPLLRGS